MIDSATTTPTLFERELAALSIALLRDGGMADTEILKSYTTPRPRQDRVYERLVQQEHGVAIVAARIKRAMIALLVH